MDTNGNGKATLSWKSVGILLAAITAALAIHSQVMIPTVMAQVEQRMDAKMKVHEDWTQIETRRLQDFQMAIKQELGEIRGLLQALRQEVHK